MSEWWWDRSAEVKSDMKRRMVGMYNKSTTYLVILYILTKYVNDVAFSILPGVLY